jgi:hypothetical protein
MNWLNEIYTPGKQKLATLSNLYFHTETTYWKTNYTIR